MLGDLPGCHAFQHPVEEAYQGGSVSTVFCDGGCGVGNDFCAGGVGCRGGWGVGVRERMAAFPVS